MSERLTDADIAAIAVSGHDGRAHAVPRWACRSLAAEVQASRKLIAELRVLPYYAIDIDLLRRLIDGAGL